MVVERLSTIFCICPPPAPLQLTKSAQTARAAVANSLASGNLSERPGRCEAALMTDCTWARVRFKLKGRMDSLLALACNPNAWAALGALVVMEVVLGVDNLVFVAVLTNGLPKAMRAKARKVGLGLALILRLALLGVLVFVIGLTRPVVTVMGHGFSWRDLILGCGGLFLVWKATQEIHHAMDPDRSGPDETRAPRKAPVFAAAIVQILLLDLVFSIDSILTAVGMTDQLPIMALAVIVAVGLMLVASGPMAAFIHKNPTIVMLALGFLLMIGMTLIAEAFGVDLPKGYIYAAMAFSAFVEGLNMLARRRRRPASTE
jgi:predicted tellurium resistance membrane protein TerC